GEELEAGRVGRAEQSRRDRRRGKPPAAVTGCADDLLLGPPATEGWYAAERERTDRAEHGDHGELSAEAHAAQLLAADRRDRHTGGEEEQRLERRVRDEVRESRGGEPGADRHEHQPVVRGRRRGEQLLR